MKWWIVCLVIGIIPLIASTGIFRGDGTPGEIKCGDVVMAPGDVCEETRGGDVVGTYTYEDKVTEIEVGADNFASTGRWIQLGIGVVLVGAGITGIVVTRRRRALNQGHQVPPGAYPGFGYAQPPVGYPQHQAAPPQGYQPHHGYPQAVPGQAPPNYPPRDFGPGQS